MWLNGMIHHDNPLSKGELDEAPYDLECYGDDPDGPTPLHSRNNVVFEEVDLRKNDTLQSFVLERLDPLRELFRLYCWDYRIERLFFQKVRLCNHELPAST